MTGPPPWSVSRLKHVVGFGGACLGGQKGREAGLDERRLGGGLLANECMELSCKFCCWRSKQIEGDEEEIIRERERNGNGKRGP